jgi:phosphoglycerate dehydrogenase-like enzyme
MAARRRRGLLLALRRAGGLIGFGDLARAFTPLLAPFGCPIKAYDPWVSDHFMAGFGVVSASLEGVLKTSEVIVVFAAVTSDTRGSWASASSR